MLEHADSTVARGADKPAHTLEAEAPAAADVLAIVVTPAVTDTLDVYKLNTSPFRAFRRVERGRECRKQQCVHAVPDSVSDEAIEQCIEFVRIRLDIVIVAERVDMKPVRVVILNVGQQRVDYCETESTFGRVVRVRERGYFEFDYILAGGDCLAFWVQRHEQRKIAVAIQIQQIFCVLFVIQPAALNYLGFS